MLKPSDLVTVTFIVLSVGIASAQGSHYPIMEKIAQKILQKDQTASCEQLAQENGQPPTGETAPMEPRAGQILHTDPPLRSAFLPCVAAPMTNNLFACGLSPFTPEQRAAQRNFSAARAYAADMEIEERPSADIEQSRPSIDDAPPADFEPSTPEVEQSPSADIEQSRPSIDDAPPADFEPSTPEVEESDE